MNISILVSLVVFLVVLIFLVSLVLKKKEPEPQEEIIEPVEEKRLFDNESISGSVFGIMRDSPNVNDFLKSDSSKPELTRRTYLENTLFLTNHRLLFIQIPISGVRPSDKMDISTYNFLHNRREIKNKGKQILDTLTPLEILQYKKNEILYDDIKLISLKNMDINIEKNNGERLKYTFLDKEYVDNLRHLLRLYLKDKFIG